MSSIARTDLLAKLVGAYREAAREATPNNDLISRKEQRSLSGWAQSVANRLRDKKGKGALIGAIVGAAAGTAIAAKTEGEEVELPAGTELTLILNRPATVTLRP